MISHRHVVPCECSGGTGGHGGDVVLEASPNVQCLGRLIRVRACVTNNYTNSLVSRMTRDRVRYCRVVVFYSN